MFFPIATTTLLALASPSQGLFESPIPIATNPAPVWALEAGDLNADGLEDIVFLSSYPVSVSIALAVPGGGFSNPELAHVLPGTDFPANANFLHVRSADLDGDGTPELVVVTLANSGSSARVWSLSRDGAGGYDAPVAHANLSQQAVAIDVADLNTDGFPDVLIADLQGGVQSVLGTASGLSGTVVPLLPSSFGADTLAAADFDGDGFMDIAVNRAFPGATDPQVLFGNGTGQFPTANAVFLDVSPQRLIAADLDLDGDADLVSVGQDFRVIQIIENLGSRMFETVERYVPGLDNRVEVVDLDGDGLQDLLLRSTSVNRNRAMLGLGGLQFDAPSLPSGIAGLVGTTIDLNGDGRLDAVYDGTADPTMDPRTLLMIGAIDPISGYQFTIGDEVGETLIAPLGLGISANGDLMDDLLLHDQEQHRVKLSLGGGRFEAAHPVPFSGPTASLGTFGDFTGDGFGDAVAYVAGTQALEVSAGDGTGGFASAGPLLTLPSEPSHLKAVELNSDDFTDLVWALPSSNEVGFAFGGPGGISTSSLLPIPVDQWTSISVGDMDNDGLVDLLITNRVTIAFASQIAGQSFGPPLPLLSDATFFFFGATPSDVNGDGLLDIAFATQNDLEWLEALGGGTFAPRQSISTFRPQSSPISTDLDRDGDEDLIWVFSNIPIGGGDLTWSRNDGTGQLSDPEVILRGFQGVPLDADGDGDLDFVRFFSPPGPVSKAELYENNALGALGSGVCSSVVPNSTGAAGELSVLGSDDLGLGAVRLTASALPAGAFGYFLCSQQAGFTQTVPGSVGSLCLGGPIGRFSRPTEIGTAGSSGSFSLDIDVTALPTPSLGRVPILPGDTWVFQMWHVDATPIGTTSNFTEAVSVTF